MRKSNMFMTISDRQKGILDAIIREYVESAKPVSSQFLGEKHDFGIGPASIRIEMQKLTDDGFLTQPHTSAGRIPTDKGYRFFVDELLDERERLACANLDFESDFDDIFRDVRQLAHSVAMTSESLVLGYLANEDILFKEGWEELLRQPEFGQEGLIDNFLDYLSYLETNIEKIKPESDFKLLIGRENMYPRAHEFSLFSVIFKPVEKEEVILSIVGPKRMAYDRNIALANELIKLCDNL